VNNSMEVGELDPEGVSVAFVRPAGLDDATTHNAALDILSEDEIHRADRYRFERDRRLFVASRALVRRSLSRWAKVDPADWRFSATALGRLFVAYPGEARELRFSASRTDALAMCAIAYRREVGVDVEALRTCPLDVVDACFTPPEARAIRERFGEARSERFFALWTLKEAYVKARGLGLTLPFGKFAFQLADDQQPRLKIDPSLDNQAAAWRFTLTRPTATHLAALCIFCPDRPVVPILANFD
jgi:4'-phosphopantetheinyl transferase